MNSYLETSARAVTQILETSWQAAVLAALVVVFILVLRDRLSARWRSALWLLVVARLLMPVAPESPVSLFNFLPAEITWTAFAVSTPVETPQSDSTLTPVEPSSPIAEPMSTMAFEPGRTDLFPFPMQSITTDGDIVTKLPPEVAESVVEAKTVASRPTVRMVWLAVIVAWFFGTIFLAFRLGLLSLRLRFLLQKCRPVESPSVLAAFEAARRELGVRRRVELLTVSLPVGPAVTGIFRPRLILGESLLPSLTVDELRLVFLHELSHVRRQDLLVQRLWQLAEALHWFNPIVWLAARRWQTDRELACDEAVLARLDREHRASYGHAILRVMESLSTLRPVPGAVGVLMRRGFLTNRITFITRYRPLSRRWTALAIGLLLLLIPIGLTNAVGKSGPVSEEEQQVAAVTEKTTDTNTTTIETKSKYEKVTREDSQRLQEKLPDCPVLFLEGSDADLGKEIEMRSGSSKTFTGRVYNQQTKEPIPNAQIKITSFPLPNGWIRDVTGQTDSDGLYRIEAKPGFQFGIVVTSSPDAPYFPQQIFSPNPKTDDQTENPTDAETIDIGLEPGMFLEGKVIHSESKQPVSGVEIEYVANETGRTPGYRAIHLDLPKTDANGRFKAVVLPGKGHLLAHCPGGGFIQQEIDSNQLYNDSPGGFRRYAHAIQPIDLEPDHEADEVTLEMEPGEKTVVTITDEEGKPINNVTTFTTLNINGVRASGQAIALKPIADSEFELTGLAKDTEYRVYFLQCEKQLGTTAILKAGDRSTIVLKPCGKAVATLVDKNDQPATEFPYYLLLVHQTGVSPFNSSKMRNEGKLSATYDFAFSMDPINYPTDPQPDPEGHITFHALIPGATYWIHRGIDRQYAFKKEFTVEPGQTLELGKIVVPQDEGTNVPRHTFAGGYAYSDEPSDSHAPKDSKEKDEPPAPKSTDTTNPITISGRCVDEEGQPVAGAHIAVVGNVIAYNRHDYWDPRTEVLNETTADSDGRYQLTLQNVSPKSHNFAKVLARAEGTAPAAKSLRLDANEADITLTLAQETPIHLRFVDSQGQPAKGVKVSCTFVSPTSDAASADSMPTFYNPESDEQPLKAWLPPGVTDQQGRLVLHGIPNNHTAGIAIEGTEHFAPQRLSLSSGESDENYEKILLRQDLRFQNVKPGEEAVITLAGVQILEGTVRYEDTGEPVAGARIEIASGMSTQAGSSLESTTGQTDAEGHYRISVKPGYGFIVKAYPPDGVPYLGKNSYLAEPEKDAPLEPIDLTLPRGILVRGKVIDSKSKQPIARAMIQYRPETRNNPNSGDYARSTQHSDITDENGQFAIVVLPGPGRLFADASVSEFIKQEISSDEVEGNPQPGGDRHYINAIKPIHPTPDTEAIEVTMLLERGEKVVGRVVNEKGKSVEKAVILKQQDNPTFTSLGLGKRRNEKVSDGKFEIAGLAKDTPYPTYFIDIHNRLGAIKILKAGDTPTVVLKPCGQAVATIVNPDGQPAVTCNPYITIVTKPGYAMNASRPKEFRADETILSNIDRVNYYSFTPPVDDTGQITFPALIPGATYRIYANDRCIKTFTIESGQTLDLGKIVIRSEKATSTTLELPPP